MSSCSKRIDFSKSCLNHCPISKVNNGLLFFLKKTLVQFSMTLARKMAAVGKYDINIKGPEIEWDFWLAQLIHGNIFKDVHVEL